MGKYDIGVQAEHDMLTQICNDLNSSNIKYYKVLTDVCYYTKSKKLAQIDAIIVCEYGVFCIEFKHWKGLITPSNMQRWSVKWRDRYYTYPNPAFQNLKHTIAIEALLRTKFSYGSSVNVFSLVSFDTIATLNNLSINTKYADNKSIQSNVMYSPDVVSYISRVFASNGLGTERAVLKEQRVNEITNYLSSLKDKYGKLFTIQQAGIAQYWY